MMQYSYAHMLPCVYINMVQYTYGAIYSFKTIQEMGLTYDELFV